MSETLRIERITGYLFYFLYLLLIGSLIFSFRAISSIAITAILLAGMLVNGRSLKNLFRFPVANLVLASILLFFLLQILSISYTQDIRQGWINVRIKAGLPAIALAICFTGSTIQQIRKNILTGFVLLLVLATLYCLLVNAMLYFGSSDSSLFFYHALVAPIKQHAIYFSLLVLTAIFYLMEPFSDKDFLYSMKIRIPLIICLSLFLVLLSSRLVISFYLLYLLFRFISSLKSMTGKKRPVFISIVIALFITGLLFFTSNRVSNRFRELIQSDLSLVSQEQFSQSDYFNGLQFRLLQWKLVPQILNERKSWWMGVGPGDGQAMLNEKYLSLNMYAGDPATGSRGYLLYNTHNQFLETLLQTGIIGLTILMLFMVPAAILIISKKNRMVSAVGLLLLAWLFTEAALETQYGVMILSFFILFLSWPAEDQQPKGRQTFTGFDPIR